MTTTEERTRVEIWRSKKKILGLLAIAAAFSVGGVMILLHPGGERNNVAIGALCVLFFGPGALFFLWQLILARQPALILSDSGLSYPAVVNGPVFWSDVQNVYLSVVDRNASLHLMLYPQAAGRLERKGIMGGTKRWRGRELIVPLAMLDVQPQRLADCAATQVEAAKTVRPPESELHAVDAAPAEPEIALGAPYFAIALSVVLSAIFAGELLFGPFPTVDAITPSVGTLFAFGGVTSLSVHDGDWWRLFTAPLLHGGLFHLVLNVVALLVAGFQLERLIGSAWFAGIFAASALAGSLASLIFNAPNVVSVGASGGVVGLFVATAVTSYHFPPGPSRNHLLTGAFQILLPSLLPFLSVKHGMQIDYASHFGGAAGGLVLGFALLRLWPTDRPKPEWRKLPIALAAGFFVVAIGAAAPVARQIERVAWLAPDFPEDWEQAKAHSSTALAKYPRDSRVRLAHAVSLIDQGWPGLAEKELLTALEDDAALHVQGLNHMEARVRLVLATIVVSDGRRDEARTVVSPICRSQLPDALAKLRASLSVCP